MQCATVFQKRRAGVMRCSAKPRHRRGKFTRAHWRPSSKSVYEKECGTRYAFYSTQVKAIYPCEAEEQIRACGGGGGGGEAGGICFRCSPDRGVSLETDRNKYG